MGERAESDLAEREAWELARLSEVEGFIQLRATKWAMGDPMLAEDLAQQAREAVIRRLRENPDCPYSHLVNKARDAIWHYRVKGKSVDGLLYPRGRARQYETISLEEPIGNKAEASQGETSLGEVLSDLTHPRRITEERAIAEVLVETIRSYLSPKGNDALTLRLWGFTWKEIRVGLNLNYWELEVIKKDLAGVRQLIWGAK